MTSRHLVLSVIVSVSVAVPLFAQGRGAAHPGAPPPWAAVVRDDRIEPSAGNWRTWVISSGADYRVPPPPGPAETRKELRDLADLIAGNAATAQDQIRYWDAGSPPYRWIDLLNQRFLAGVPTTAYPHRAYAYVALAMYDATVAAWDSKYFYDRPRPSELDHKLPTSLRVPNSPSYPSEHAAVAWAAATVLEHLCLRARPGNLPGCPLQGPTFQDMAREAGWSRVLAGLQFPSDYEAGKKLGISVAQAVIQKADADLSDAAWTGTVPTGPCKWIGTNPGNAAAANWRPLLLSSPSQFRPPAPPACDSPEGRAQLDAVRTFQRTFASNYKAFYWQSPEGLQTWSYRYLDTWTFEDRLDGNPPRAARAYALLSAVQFDAFIASQDGKFAYWYIRPPQQPNSGIVPLFPIPNFPSYPSNHSTFSAARAEVVAYLFPDHADAIRAIGKEAGDSRIWAGIHYPMDNDAGVQLGKSIAQVFINWAKSDGSQ